MTKPKIPIDSNAKRSYRDLLIESEYKSQADFDKTILTLSSGALGISLIFIKNIIGDNSVQGIWLLLTAWILWSCSLTMILLSFYSSVFAHRKAREQFEDKDDVSKKDVVGGWYSKITQGLNALSALALIVGIIFMVCFVNSNLYSMGNKMKDNKPPTHQPLTPKPEKKENSIPKSVPSSPPKIPNRGTIPPPPRK